MSIAIHPVTEADRVFWFSLDRHLSAEEFMRKVRDQISKIGSAFVSRYEPIIDPIKD